MTKPGIALATVLIVALVGVLVPLTASAHTDATAQLKFDLTGEIDALQWSERWYPFGDETYAPLTGDSPLDSENEWFVVLEQLEPYEWGNAFNGTSGIKGKAVTRVRNLSFDWAGDVGANVRGPRIHVNFTNGGYAFLSQWYCHKQMFGGDSDWFRADFTSQKAVNGQACGFWVRMPTGAWQFYGATATRSAWKTFVAAKPGFVVKNAYWTYDDGADYTGIEAPPGSSQTNSGGIVTMKMDRLAIQDHMWTSPTTVKHCPTEASC